ncbi:MAG: hypothetical protein ACI4NG_04450 [Candidatus Gallimonas sp.]
MKIAVIDIGSNSVRLMMWANGKTLYKRLNSTRLGEGVALRPVLKEEAIERTAQAVAAFYRAAVGDGAEKVYAFATAAVRCAENGSALIERVAQLCPLSVETVLGEEEAQLALAGALGAEDGSVIDVGGASTEICSRSCGKLRFVNSLNVGAVRLYDRCGDDRDKLQEEIGEALAPIGGTRLTGRACAVGGTATTLAAYALGLTVYDGERIDGARLTATDCGRCADELLAMTAEERAERICDRRRADIIAGGALLLAELMKKLSLAKLFVSDRDNLEGYLYRRCLHELP